MWQIVLGNRNHTPPRWGNVDWLHSKLSVEQRIYRQHVDDTKTHSSSADLDLDPSVLQVLKEWRQDSQFRGDEDWMFASPTQLGRLPISYPWFWRSFNDDAVKAGIGALGTHTLRHTYRSWLDSIGAPVAVQQKLMRHSDIRTTMNVYGDVVDDRMKQAHSKVVALMFKSTVSKNDSPEDQVSVNLALGSA
jgi:integrase